MKKQFAKLLDLLEHDDGDGRESPLAIALCWALLSAGGVAWYLFCEWIKR